jgi:transcriptional regulator with XRE-family HTH domain
MLKSYPPIGRVICAFRKQRRMTQSELAEKLGVHPSTICRLESDDSDSISVKTLSEVAKALNIPMREFIFGLLDTADDELAGYSSLYTKIRALFKDVDESNYDKEDEEFINVLRLLTSDYLEHKTHLLKGKSEGGNGV